MVLRSHFTGHWCKTFIFCTKGKSGRSWDIYVNYALLVWCVFTGWLNLFVLKVTVVCINLGTICYWGGFNLHDLWPAVAPGIHTHVQNTLGQKKHAQHQKTWCQTVTSALLWFSGSFNWIWGTVEKLMLFMSSHQELCYRASSKAEEENVNVED